MTSLLGFHDAHVEQSLAMLRLQSDNLSRDFWAAEAARLRHFCRDRCSARDSPLNCTFHLTDLSCSCGIAALCSTLFQWSQLPAFASLCYARAGSHCTQIACAGSCYKLCLRKSIAQPLYQSQSCQAGPSALALELAQTGLNRVAQLQHLPSFLICDALADTWQLH